MKMGRKFLAILVGAVITLICLAGCGSVRTDTEHSPNLINMEINSYNEGSETKQYVEAVLEFDKPVSVSDKKQDSLRITIGGERVKEDEYQIQQGDDKTKVSLIISVEYVTIGVITIDKSDTTDTISDIRDEAGEYAVIDFSAEGLIPTGVTLSTAAADDTGVTKKVESVWNIRSIAWLGLVKDGEEVQVKEEGSEVLDGRIAVHGHEFLTEDENAVAERIAETMQYAYGSGYKFTSDNDTITMKAPDTEKAEYDIEIYQYVKINGKEPTAETEAHEGSKVRTAEKDRKITADEQKFLDKLHISQLSDEQIKDGSEVYSQLTVTGDAAPEEAKYSIKDLEELIRLSFENSEMNKIGLPEKVNTGNSVYYGLDLSGFMKLNGIDMENNLYVALDLSEGRRETAEISFLADDDVEAVIAFADSEGALHADDDGVSGPAAVILKNSGSESVYSSVRKITVSENKHCADPEYRFHNRKPWIKDKDKTFTVEVYKKGSEYLGAVKSRTFTTEEFEKLMKKNPEHVVGNYYGTIGNQEEFQYIGVGGWIDYFEGLDLEWILIEQLGLEKLSGSAELIGRDGEVYGTIEKLEYLADSNNDSDYYVLTSEGIKIPGTVPMIACTKNGYPILSEHEHESSAYIAYNHLNDQLYKRGIGTEIGVVKNHNGPFVACLGNLDGFYGGAEVETGGDCVLMKIYIE